MLGTSAVLENLPQFCFKFLFLKTALLHPFVCDFMQQKMCAYNFLGQALDRIEKLRFTLLKKN